MIKKILQETLKIIHLLIFGKLSYAKSIGVTIGNNCRIYITNWGTEPFLINIGSNVTITEGVKFITHDGSSWLFNDKNGRRFIYRRISVGDNVFIGVNSIILSGVKIENNVIVAAGSVVTKSVPAGVIVGGNPAKIIGKYTDYESKALQYFISEKDIDFNLKYMQRIESSMTEGFKGFIQKNNSN